MKQLIQNFKSGELYIDEVPLPAISKGMILIENHFSLISSGTERSTVNMAKASLLGKAKQRPELVRQVIANLRKEGLKATLGKVQTKLNSLKALGYSSAGTVLASMDTNLKFRNGDRVACAGQDYASHAEVICVPQNLVAKIPENVSNEEAAFTTLGAIALQGVRQADPTLGESVCVIGLGLLGQLTIQLLKANGCKVMGIDLSAQLVSLAIGSGADEANLRNDPDIEANLESFTAGEGFDRVIITAATSSNDPIEFAAKIARKKGRIVVVGAVKMDIPRDPHFYRKELDLRMSCSYGPGRYDVIYEEQGIDYPIGYIRWTEQRNMEAFLQLLSQKKLDIKSLITHRFDIDEAENAYDLVMGKVQEFHLGILLQYPSRQNKFSPTVTLKKSSPVQSLSIGFIGAGSFAQSYLIPTVKAWGADLNTVVTSRGINAKNVAEKFSFRNASSNVADILANDSIDTVFIATPHNSHAQLTIEALKAGKNIFVEKPLALNEEELLAVKSLYQLYPRALMVGFNRRFSPLAKKVHDEFGNLSEPLVINYRVNAGFISKEHWTQQDEVGGGRIMGECCHFIDLMQFFTGSRPSHLFAQCIRFDNNRMKNEDNLCVNIAFENGSIGNLVYLANGDKALAKERIEIFGGGKVAVIDDFRRGNLFMNNRQIKWTEAGKGHKEEVELFLNKVKQGHEAPIPFDSIYTTTKACLLIKDSLYTGLPQKFQAE